MEVGGLDALHAATGTVRLGALLQASGRESPGEQRSESQTRKRALFSPRRGRALRELTCLPGRGDGSSYWASEVWPLVCSGSGKRRRCFKQRECDPQVERGAIWVHEMSVGRVRPLPFERRAARARLTCCATVDKQAGQASSLRRSVAGSPPRPPARQTG